MLKKACKVGSHYHDSFGNIYEVVKIVEYGTEYPVITFRNMEYDEVYTFSTHGVSGQGLSYDLVKKINITLVKKCGKAEYLVNIFDDNQTKYTARRTRFGDKFVVTPFEKTGVEVLDNFRIEVKFEDLRFI